MNDLIFFQIIEKKYYREQFVVFLWENVICEKKLDKF